MGRGRGGLSRKAKRRETWRKLERLARAAPADLPAAGDAITSDGKRGPWLNLKRISAMAGAILALAGAYFGWVAFQPNISIAVQEPLTFQERYSPYFIVRNGGSTDAHNVTFNCGAMFRYTQRRGAPVVAAVDLIDEVTPRLKGAEYTNIGTLRPGEQAVRRCRIVFGPYGQLPREHTMLFPVITHTSSWRPWTEDRIFFFELSRSEEGALNWRFRGEGLSAEQAEELYNQGATVFTLNSANESMKEWAPPDG